VHAALQALEARASCRIERDDLAVEREVSAAERRERRCDLRVAIGHPRATARPELDLPPGAQREHAHAVPLELEEPAGPARHLLHQRRQHEREARGREAHARQGREPSGRPHGWRSMVTQRRFDMGRCRALS